MKSGLAQSDPIYYFQRKMEVMTGNTFGAIAYGAAKMSGASEDRANLAGAFGSGLDLLGVAATGGGMLRTKTISPAAIEGMNGNSKLSSRTTYLYELYLKDGTFLKNGVTINLDTRYTKSYMADKDIFPISSGTRTDMLNLERQRTLSNPGPYNNESWAVKVKNARGNQ